MKHSQQVIKLSLLIVLHLKIAPTGTVKSIDVLQINQTSIRIMWEVVDCDKRNGRIIEYNVIISNNCNTYNLTSTERYITVNDLVLGGIYNISVAAVNSIGSGPFNYTVLQFITGMISNHYYYDLFSTTTVTISSGALIRSRTTTTLLPSVAIETSNY